MNDTTQQPTHLAAAPKRAHQLIWLFLGFVMLICTGAAGAVYLEHRLSQYHAAQETLNEQRTEKASPSPATLQMLTALQTKVKTLEETLAKANASLSAQDDALAEISGKENPNDAAIKALEAKLAEAETQLATLNETVKAHASPVNTYAEVLRSFLQLKQHIGSKQAADDVSAFTSRLDAIAINPKQLAVRARIAEQASHIEAALTHDVPSHEVLSQELHKAISSIKPKPAERPAADDAKAQSFWDKLANLSRRHVRIEPEADAKARDDYETLRALEERDDFLAAARTISAMDHAPEALITWRVRAKHYLAISRALDAIEADLITLTQES